MTVIISARIEEAVILNMLSTNRHLLLATFFKPSDTRDNIFIESYAFPSDKYVITSQPMCHSLVLEGSVIELTPGNNRTLTTLDHPSSSQ